MGFTWKKTLKSAEGYGKQALLSPLDALYGTKGVKNPYGPPDVNALYDPSQYDFLKTYNPDPNYMKGSDTAFQDLLGSIGATNTNNNDLMTLLLAGTDLDTAKAAADTELNFQDRGLGGAGLFSDLEAGDLGGVMAEGAKTKALTRGTFADKQLQLANSAYGQRYQDLFNQGTTNQGIGNQRQLALAQILSGLQTGKATDLTNLYNAGVKNQTDTAKNPFWEDILRNSSVKLNA